jgi:hypothetical protein
MEIPRSRRHPVTIDPLHGLQDLVARVQVDAHGRISKSVHCDVDRFVSLSVTVMRRMYAPGGMDWSIAIVPEMERRPALSDAGKAMGCGWAL